MKFPCSHPLSKEAKQVKKEAKLLQAISEVNRLRILCLLSRGEFCVCELVKSLNLPQNLVSHHLRVLKKSKLVSDKRRGQRIYYLPTPKGKKVTNFLLNIIKKEVVK